MKITSFLFYLLLALLPTQLGRHFFFDFSLLSGIRSDYLAPTIYLTDVIIILLIGIEVSADFKYRIANKSEARSTKSETILNDQNPNDQNSFEHFIFRILSLFRYSNLGFRILFIVICYLLFNSLIIASNQWAAFYKLVKIIEFILLGWVIIRIKPKLLTVLTVLSFAVFYTSLIAFGQFFLQKSIGGLFWFLGERTFYAGTPGIAATSFGGRLILRPYATFPHPNVMGGFLAVVLPVFLNVIFKYHRHLGKLLTGWFLLSFTVGLSALFLSFSRAAWGVVFVGFLFLLINWKNFWLNWLKRKSSFSLIVFYLLIFSSVVLPIISSQNILFSGQSWQERLQLIKGALAISSQYPYFGVGLNNFIVQSRSFIDLYSGIYLFQPVHNIYLLVLAETGLVGLLLFLFSLFVIWRRSFRTSSFITLALIQLFLLGLFDHYLFTLQQGQLLFTLFTSLALNQNKYGSGLTL